MQIKVRTGKRIGQAVKDCCELWGDNQAWPPTTHKYTQVSSDKNKRGGDVSIKEKREKEKESQEKRKEKITKKRLKRSKFVQNKKENEVKTRYCQYNTLRNVILKFLLKN